MKIHTALGTATALAVASIGVANAQDPSIVETTGPYFGLGYNYIDFDDDFGGDASVDSIAVRAGWQFTPNLSAELEGNFGAEGGDFDFDTTEEDFDLDDNNDGDLDDVINSVGELEMDYLVGAFARATFPVGDRLDLSARVGYAFAELDSTLRTPGGNEFNIRSGSDDGFAVGASATFDMTEAWGLRAGYTRYEFDDVDADSVDLQLQYKF